MREYGSEHSIVILPDGYLEGLSRFGNTKWLRSGREGLYYVARNIKNKENSIILFPAYCCWSMSAPFYKAGWQIKYYRLNEDLTVNIDYLHELIDKYNPDAVLTMNFYGSSKTNDSVSLIKQLSPDCICVEDFSHCTFSFEEIYNPLVDFYVTSVRKSVGVSDGAIVIANRELNDSILVSDTNPFSENREIAQLKKFHYSYSKSETEKKTFLSLLREEENRLNTFHKIHTISKVGKEMMCAINGTEIRFARWNNFKHMYELLKGNVKMIASIEKSMNGAPFSLPILVENRDDTQKKLAMRGVYTPVLWPICDEARRICPISAYISDHMLSLPIDQRYNYDDIEDIASIVLDICA